MTQQRFQDILKNFHFVNNEDDDNSDKDKALCVIFGNIHNILSSKLIPLLVKTLYGKNLYVRHSNVNIFQTHYMMRKRLNIPLWIVSNVSTGTNFVASGEMFQKIWLQICYLEVTQ